MKLFEEIKSYSSWNFCLHSYANENLVIAGDINLTYHHSIEIVFQTVSYLQIPGQEFMINSVRYATEDETKSIEDYVEIIPDEDKVFALELTTTNNDKTFFIAAQDIKLKKV